VGTHRRRSTSRWNQFLPFRGEVRVLLCWVLILAGINPALPGQNTTASNAEPAGYSWPKIHVPGWQAFQPKPSGPDQWVPGGRTPARWFAIGHSAEVSVPGKTYTREASVSVTIERFQEPRDAVAAYRRLVLDETQAETYSEGVPDLKGGSEAAPGILQLRRPAPDIQLLSEFPRGTAWLRVDLPSDRTPASQITDMRAVVVDGAFVARISTWFPDGQSLNARLHEEQLQALLQATLRAIDWWRGSTPVAIPDDVRVKLQHVAPTFDLAVDNGGGRLIVTVVDHQGQPVSGAYVGVCVEAGGDLGRVLSLRQVPATQDAPLGLSLTALMQLRSTYRFMNLDNFWLGRTNANGQATLEYLTPGCLELTGRMGAAHVFRRSGEVTGAVHAVVFESPSQTAAAGETSTVIKDHTSLQITFTAVARLVAIDSTTVGEERKVRHMRIDPSTGQVIQGSRQLLPGDIAATPAGRGVDLIPGDTILMDQNDLIRVHLVNGTKMIVTVRPGFLASQSSNGEPAPFAKFMILENESVAQQLREFIDSPLQAFAVGGAGNFVIGIVSTPAGKVSAVGYMFFVGGFKFGEHFSNPLVITPHSKLLLRLTDSGSRVMTLEGSVDVWEMATGEARRVDAGHYLPVSSTGSLGSMGSFDEENLAEEFIPAARALKSLEHGYGENVASEQPAREASGITESPDVDPESAMDLGRRGLELYSRKEYAAAIKQFDRAIQLKLDFHGAYNCRGLCYRKLGQLEPALADLNRAIELSPEFASAYSNRGNVLDDLGRYEEALRDWSRAVELDPELTQAWFNRGNRRIKEGQFDSALTDLDQAIRLEPRDGKYHHRRAYALWKKGEFKLALRSIEKAVECGHKTEELRQLRNDIYKSLAESDL
jgi:tetratricopeptide (TPR) repeat protein